MFYFEISFIKIKMKVLFQSNFVDPDFVQIYIGIRILIFNIIINSTNFRQT